MGAGEMVGAAASDRVLSAPSVEAMVRYDLAVTLRAYCFLRCAATLCRTASDYYVWSDIARDADAVSGSDRRVYAATCRDVANAMATGDLTTAVEALAKLRDAESLVSDAVEQWAAEVAQEMRATGAA